MIEHSTETDQRIAVLLAPRFHATDVALYFIWNYIVYRFFLWKEPGSDNGF